MSSTRYWAQCPDRGGATKCNEWGAAEPDGVAADVSDDRLSDDWQAPSAVIASIGTAKRSQLAEMRMPSDASRMSQARPNQTEGAHSCGAGQDLMVYATTRSITSFLSHSPIWFQLPNVWLTGLDNFRPWLIRRLA